MKKYQLMAPGPTPVPSQVLLAMAQPMIHHRTPEYEALFAEVREQLKWLFQTSQDVVLLTCSGTGAMEAVVVSTLSPGDVVAIVRAGKFADRWAELADDLRPAGRGPRGARSARRSRRPGWPKRCGRGPRSRPCSSSTARRLPVCSTTCAATPRSPATAAPLLVVDAVSSLGIADLPMDAWGVDVVVAGSQKGLMLPPGLAFCALSEQGLAPDRDRASAQVLLRPGRRAEGRGQERRALHAGRGHRGRPARGAALDAGRRAGQRIPAPRPAGPRHPRRRRRRSGSGSSPGRRRARPSPR